MAFIHLLILSGARKSEIAAARPEWLDGSVLRLPDSKTGEKSVHLPPQAMALIKRLPKTEAGCPDLRMHDLRRTLV